MKKSKFLLLILSLIICFICFTPGIYAITYNSGVLEDLNKDKNFVVSDYKSYTKEEIDLRNNDRFDDNDIQIMSMITMAESDTKELFIYIYNVCPSLNLKAKKISLSNEKRKGQEASSLKIYDLEFINEEGTLQKYKLKNYIISNDEVRYYNFICLYRDYLYGEEIDETIVNSFGENVGLQFCCYLMNNEYCMEQQIIKTVTISVKFTGHLNFTNGITIGTLFGSYEKGKLFFICFDLDDYVAERIIDADLNFRHRLVTEIWGITLTIIPGEWVDEDLTLFDTHIGEYKTTGKLAKTISWNCISKAKDFKQNMLDQKVSLSSSLKETLDSSQWVFAFYKSESKSITAGGSSSGSSTYSYEEVEEIAILRLHFIDNLDNEYNLGVVGEITSPDNKSDGEGNFDLGIDFSNLEESLKAIFKLLGMLLIIIIIVCCIPLLNFLFNGFYELIKLPDRLYKILFGKKRK